MRKIVHIITNSKFTEQYISYMVNQLRDYEHFFIINGYESANVLLANIPELTKNHLLLFHVQKALVFDRKIYSLLKSCDKIIITGFWGYEKSIFLWSRNIFSKLYIQFWGGDFYDYVTPLKAKGIRKKITAWLTKRVFVRCAGHIFLIPSDKEVFQSITHITSKKAFVAIMPWGDEINFPWKDYRFPPSSPIRILVGNSASISNRHSEAFNLLKHFNNCPLEVFCPLSYGDPLYSQNIIHLGTSIFGSKFHPLTSWMSPDEYNRFLTTIDIGVFNNNRQQAMGNIYCLLFMGKKVYLDPSTSMYKDLKSEGFELFDITRLAEINFDTFISHSSITEFGIIADSFLATHSQTELLQWKNVFDS